MTWDMWIEKGEQPLPRRFFADLSDAVAGIPGGKLAMNIQFTNWDTQADYTDADFAFTPPAGAKEGLRPAHPLEGKPAPEFTTVNLDGDEVTLANHVGKDIDQLFQVRILIPDMRLVDIDVIRAQPFQ